MWGKKQKQLKKPTVAQNQIEALKDLGTSTASSLINDLGKGTVSGLWEQLLNTGDYEKQDQSGDLSEGQELNLREIEKQPLDIEPGIDYKREILHAEEKSAPKEHQELEVKIQEIVIELKQLMNVSQEIQIQFKDIVSQPEIVNPGKYHVSFFEWVLHLIRAARLKVEDSSAWLAASQSKKAKKGYWGMFKKHGTSFGLSNERVVATQTG